MIATVILLGAPLVITVMAAVFDLAAWAITGHEPLPWIGRHWNGRQ